MPSVKDREKNTFWLPANIFSGATLLSQGLLSQLLRSGLFTWLFPPVGLVLAVALAAVAAYFALRSIRAGVSSRYGITSSVVPR